MALHEAIFGAVADLTSIAINVIAKKLGYSEVKAKTNRSLLVLVYYFVFYLSSMFYYLQV